MALYEYTTETAELQAIAAQFKNKELSAKALRKVRADMWAAAQADAISAEGWADAAEGAGPIVTPTEPTNPPVTPGGTDPDGQPTMASSAYVNGAFNNAAYAALAQKMGTDAGNDYLFGPGPAYYGTDSNANVATLWRNPDNSLDSISYQNPANAGIKYLRGCPMGHCGTWQIGGPTHPGEGGMYSSSIGQILSVPENRAAQYGGMGVTDATMLSVGENVMSTAPELSWTNAGEPGYGLDSVNMRYYKSIGKDVSYPVCVAHGEGRPGWNNASYTCFRGGFIGAAGHNTSSNKAWTQLPAGVTPVACCVTNSSEFLLVAAWNTVAMKGQVYVIALAGTGQGGYLGTDPAGWDRYRGEWKGVFPGAPNYGNTSFMKIIGAVDLPAEMKTPTAISCSLGWHWEDIQQTAAWGADGYNLHDAAVRATFRDGGQYSLAFPRHGMAVVLDKESRRAAFINLEPMMRFYKATYTGTNDFPATGLGAGQWPPTFDENAGQKPVVVKTVTFTHRPTATACFVWGPNYWGTKRGFIATQDGTMHIFTFGDYMAPNVAGTPSSIVEVGTGPCGRNVTEIAHPTRHAGDGAAGHVSLYPADGQPDFFSKYLWLAARGEREAQLFKFNTNWTGGSLAQRIKCTQITDIVGIEDQANHTTESYILTCCCYNQDQVVNIRYGRTIFHSYQGVMSDDPQNPISFNWTAGRPPNGIPVTNTVYQGQTITAEIGGVMNLKRPFRSKSANVY